MKGKDNESEHLSEEQKLTLEFIVKHSSSEIDLKWKLNKYIKTGDLSFLGIYVKELNQKIKDLNKPTATVTNE